MLNVAADTEATQVEEIVAFLGFEGVFGLEIEKQVGLLRQGRIIAAPDAPELAVANETDVVIEDVADKRRRRRETQNRLG